MVDAKPLESLQPERQRYLLDVLESMAHELEQDKEPDYFYNMSMQRRYNYVHLTISQLCRNLRPIDDTIEDGVMTPALVIDTYEEQGLSWPISLQFKLGKGKTPSFIKSDWVIQQPNSADKRNFSHSEVSIVDVSLRSDTVRYEDLTGSGRNPIRGVARRKRLNFLARSLEAYERTLIAADALPSHKRRGAEEPDIIGQAVLSIMASHDTQEAELEQPWPEY